MSVEPSVRIGVQALQETMDAKDRAFMGSQAAQEELKRRLAAAEERSHSQVRGEGPCAGPRFCIALEPCRLRQQWTSLSCEL